MRLAALFVLLLAPSINAQVWTPPEDPDLHKILSDIKIDRRFKRYDVALAKHVWFHKNALTVEPGFYGVRLSFALSDWVELAKVYPPALTKLNEIGDEARKHIEEGKKDDKEIRELFHDMESINKTLGRTGETKDVFEVLDKKNPKIAKAVFDIAQGSLIRDKAYELVGKYVSAEKDISRMTTSYRRNKKMSKELGQSHLDFANKKFTNDSTTLVAILAVTGRNEEAEKVAAVARAEWDSESFHAGLDKALEGVVPDPWP